MAGHVAQTQTGTDVSRQSSDRPGPSPVAVQAVTSHAAVTVHTLQSLSSLSQSQLAITRLLSQSQSQSAVTVSVAQSAVTVSALVEVSARAAHNAQLAPDEG